MISHSDAWLFVTSWFSPLSSSVYRIFRQEYWSELPLPSPVDLPDLWIKLTSPAWQTDLLPLSHGMPGYFIKKIQLKKKGLGFLTLASKSLLHVELFQENKLHISLKLLIALLSLQENDTFLQFTLFKILNEIFDKKVDIPLKPLTC